MTPPVIAPTMDKSVKIFVRDSRKTHPIVLIPKARARTDILGDLPNGATLVGVPISAVQNLVQHLSGGDNEMEYIFQYSSPTATVDEISMDIVQAWILAGQLKLFAVQNEILNRATEDYRRTRRHLEFRGILVPSEPFDYMRDVYGSSLNSRPAAIEVFMTYWFVGLAHESFWRNSRDLRVSLRDRIHSIMQMSRYHGDRLYFIKNQCLVSRAGDRVKPPAITIEIPERAMETKLEDDMNRMNLGSQRKKDTSGDHQARAASNPTSRTSAASSQVSKSSGASELSMSNLEALNKSTGPPLPIPHCLRREAKTARGEREGDTHGKSRRFLHSRPKPSHHHDTETPMADSNYRAPYSQTVTTTNDLDTASLITVRPARASHPEAAPSESTDFRTARPTFSPSSSDTSSRSDSRRTIRNIDDVQSKFIPSTASDSRSARTIVTDTDNLGNYLAEQPYLAGAFHHNVGHTNAPPSHVPGSVAGSFGTVDPDDSRSQVGGYNERPCRRRGDVRKRVFTWDDF